MMRKVRRAGRKNEDGKSVGDGRHKEDEKNMRKEGRGRVSENRKKECGKNEEVGSEGGGRVLTVGARRHVKEEEEEEERSVGGRRGGEKERPGNGIPRTEEKRGDESTQITTRL